MDSGIVLREIAGACYAFALPTLAARDYFNLRSDAVPIALVAYQLHRDPVVGRGRGVVEQIGRRAEVNDEGVDLAVVVVVREGCSAGHAFHVEERSGGARDVLEFPIAQAAI